MVKISTNALLSVGGSYYTTYEFDETNIKLGDIVKAQMVDKRGPNIFTKEVDLEISEEVLQAISVSQEQEKWDKHIEELSSKRPTLYAYKLAYFFDNLSDIINTREEWNMHASIVDAVDEGGYIAKHYIDEDEDEYDEHRYWREIDEYIAKMDVDDIKSFLCYDCYDWTDWEIEDLEQAIQRREDKDDTDTEEYEYLCKLRDERPDVVILLTEEEAEEFKAPERRGVDVIVDGFEYLCVDSI